MDRPEKSKEILQRSLECRTQAHGVLRPHLTDYVGIQLLLEVLLIDIDLLQNGLGPGKESLDKIASILEAHKTIGQLRLWKRLIDQGIKVAEKMGDKQVLMRPRRKRRNTTASAQSKSRILSGK
jgi:hypothetical protein